MVGKGNISKEQREVWDLATVEGAGVVGGPERMAAAMLAQAVEEARRYNSRAKLYRLDAKRRLVLGQPIHAVVWLASNWAAPWFDLVRVDQRAFLERIGWREWAESIAGHRDSWRLGWRRLRVLRKGLELVDPYAAAQALDAAARALVASERAASLHRQGGTG